MRFLAATALLVVAVALAGCGGGGAEARAKGHYGSYQSLEVGRSTAEGELNRAFRDLASAAGERDRGAVLAAVQRGRRAAQRIHRSLERELRAASGLADYRPTRAHARRLERALGQSRNGLRLFERELDIAERDPFLDRDENADEVRRLSRRGVVLSVSGAFGRRRAARAIAVALGVDPPVDVMFDFPRDSPSS